MGVSRSGVELSRKMFAAGVILKNGSEDAVSANALHLKRTVMALAPARLSGVGKRGARLNVRYAASGERAVVFATGPWQFIENDTKPHVIPRETSRGRRRYAVIPGVGVFSRVEHPGTQGKHPWRKGVDIAVPQFPQVQKDRAHAALKRIF